MNKKWHENIPENGILVSDDSAVFLIKSSDIGNYELNEEIETGKVKPITAAEWWKVAPWQSMGSAPTGTAKFLGMLDNGEIVECHIYKSGIIKNGDFVVKIIKWLPLPMG